MLEWIAALLMIAASYSLLRFGLWLVKFYKYQHQQYVDSVKQFNAQANALLENEKLSSGDIDFIDDMVSTINRHETAMVFLQILIDKKKKKPENKVRANRISDHLTKEHLDLHYLWFTAVTAKSPFFGSLIRVVIAQQNIPKAVTEVSHKANTVRKASNNKLYVHA